MDDSISRRQAIDTLTRLEPSFRGSVLEQALKNMPSTQTEPIKINIEDFNKEDWERFKKEWENTPITVLPAQSERKKGRWIRNDNGTYSCSVCQSWIPEQQHCYARYCLYCGADMRGETDG